MKKINLIMLLVSINISFISPLRAMTEKELWGLLSFADTEESAKKAYKEAVSNPDLLEKIVFIPDNQLSNRVGRSNAIALLIVCAKENRISQARLFNIISKSEANPPAMPGRIAKAML